MRKLLPLAALLATAALAGENKYLGRILSPAGQPRTNASTLFPFSIPPGSKVTFWCSVATNVLTDALTTNAVYDGGSTTLCNGGDAVCNQPFGVPFAATTLYPTSVGSSLTTRISTTAPDGGSGPSLPTALIAIQPTTNATGFCDVWQRVGNE